MRPAVRRSVACTLLVFGLLCAQPASVQAGVYSDDLAKCLVNKTTQKDQTDLLRWMFSAVAWKYASEQ